ncbi:MAG TPA: hypothetical protein VKV96_10375 [Roseiarcus sp.]|nr:hypothetical protein [Roseiarcus sp.]
MSPHDHQPDEGPNRAVIAAVIFVALIVLGGVWLFEKLSAANDALNCVASGRRNCQQIDQ